MLAFVAGDYDLSGVVDNSDYNEWRANFGNTTLSTEAPVDGNSDGIVDAADYVVWRKNLGKTLADVAPNGPRLVEARAVGATSIEVQWEASANTTSYAVQRRATGSETEFTTIAPSVATPTYTDNTATANTLYEYRVVAQNANGNSPGSQIAQATANQASLTAYRPQGVLSLQGANNPKYEDPFPRTEVSEEDENTTLEGPGIRINADDDNQNGQADRAEMGSTIAEENDLIELRIDRLPGQGNMVLSAGPQLLMWTNYSKTTQVESNTPITFAVGSNSTSVWVEWVDSEHGTESITLFDQATMTPHDTVRFHSFRSMVVVFGGNGQNPFDGNRDGNIADPIKGDPGNSEGIFHVAMNMYVTGWDVYAYNEETNLNFVHNEILNGFDRRFVGPDFMGGPEGGVAIMGYSHGAGATRMLIEMLTESDPEGDFITQYGVYLDGVTFGGITPENTWPEATFYMLNIYETVDPKWHGADIDDDEVLPGALLEEHNVTDEISANIDHEHIDDNVQVQATIRARLESLMER
jgi:hypothetical protein